MTDAHKIVLHHLVIRGRADVPALAASTGLEPDVIEQVLASLEDDELVVQKAGRIAGHAPTQLGKDLHDEHLGEDELRRRREELDPWYGEFEEVNIELKELCTAWQLVDGPDGQRVNDHSDPAYDAAIIEQLDALHGRVASLLHEPGHERLVRYERRLADALTEVRSGNVRRFTAPLAESYHDVWMELHHDLLRSLDKRRTGADA